MLCWSIISVVILVTFGSAIGQSPCGRKTDKNGFSVSEIDLICDLSKSGETRPKLIENILNNFDVQRLGSDSNGWVFRFRDRFGKVRSLVISNLEKSRKLFSIPRNIFGNYEEVIGDSNWNSKFVKDSVGKFLLNPKKVDYDIRPPSMFTLSDIFRSLSTILKPNKYSISDLKKNADNISLNKRNIDKNKERLGKSVKMFGLNNKFEQKLSNKKVEQKIYDKQYLEIISKINDMSNAMKIAEKQSETKPEKTVQNLEIIVKENNNSSKISLAKVKKVLLKQKKPIKVLITKQKPDIKASKTTEKAQLTQLNPSETDQQFLMSPTFVTQSQSSPPLKRIPLSASVITGNQNIWPNKLIVPKIAPPTPLITPTSVLSLPIDFAQTILPEPTSDIDTFTYRDAVIVEDSQKFRPNDKEMKLFSTINIEK